MKPRIIFFVKNIFSVKGGGERSTINLINLLHEHGYEILLVTMEPRDVTAISPFASTITVEHIEFNSNHPASFAAFIKLIFSLRVILSSNKSAYFVGVGNLCYSILSIASVSLPRTRIVAIEHSIPRHYRSRLIQLALISIFSFRYYHFFVVSLLAKKQFSRYIFSPVSILPNSLDYIPKFGQYTSPGELKIICISRLSIEKRPLHIASAFYQSMIWRCGWSLHFYGDGPLRNQLFELIAECPSSNIFVHGNSSNIFYELKSSSFSVHGSMYESVGLSFLESLSAGVPCIASSKVKSFNLISKSSLTKTLFFSDSALNFIAVKNIKNAFVKAANLYNTSLYSKMRNAALIDYQTFKNHYSEISPLESFTSILKSS